MKNLKRIKAARMAVGIIALIALIGFTMSGCDILDELDNGGTTTNASLDGIWGSEGYVYISINGNTGTLTQISSTNALYLNAVSKGYIKIGDAKFRNITKTGDLTWRYEELTVRYNS